MRPLVAGTRGSALALWQTEHAASLLRAAAVQSGRPLELKVQIITTRGDTDQSPVLAGKLGKGFFTLELEAALRAGEIDLAVHSLKDLPTEPPPGLVNGAILERGPAHDLLIARAEAIVPAANGQLPLKKGARVGSSSLRRAALLKRYAPHAIAEPLRGNVPTRVSKLVQGKYDAIVLAAAGVTRLALDLSACAAFDLNPRVWVPAPGQGAVAIQCREDDHELRGLLEGLTHRATADATARERLYLQGLEGGCTTPFGCLVHGADVCLGLDIHGGWRRAVLAHASGDAANVAAKIAATLTAMQAGAFREVSGGDDHEWLCRTHKPSEVQVA
jgi:hydroxymethylbilane synthase